MKTLETLSSGLAISGRAGGSSFSKEIKEHRNPETEIKENRNLTIDILKGFGIIFVVLGHCERGTGFSFFSPYSFHMPLFIFCSGYFYKQVDVGKLSDIKMLLKKMILPLIIWGSVYYVAQALINGVNGSFVSEVIVAAFLGNYAYNVFMIPCWFVGCLFMIRLYFLFVHARIMRLLRQNIVVELIMTALYGGLCLYSVEVANVLRSAEGEVWLLHKVILRICFGAFFYYFGYMFHKYEKYLLKSMWLTLGGCIIVASILKAQGIALDFWMDRMLFNTKLWPIVTSLTGITFFFIISRILADSHCGLSGIVGKNSMNILVHHIFLMYVVNFIFATAGIIEFEQIGIMKFDDIPKIYYRYKSGITWPIYCGISIIVPVYAAKIYRKNISYITKLLQQIETIGHWLKNVLADGWIVMKDKVRQSRLYFAFMTVALAMIVIGVFLYSDELPQSVEHEYLTSYTVAEFNNISLRDGEIVQEFTAEQDNLHIFYVWLKNCSSSDNGVVKIEILDRLGKQYYEGQYALNELGDGGFCWVGGMQDSLKKGEKYELILSTADAMTNVEIQAVTGSIILDSMEKLTVNGIEQEDSALYMLQQYEPTSYSLASIWIFLWTMAGVLGAVFIFSGLRNVRELVRISIVIWTVAAAFLSVELLQGSVRTMGLKYILFNFAIVFSLFLIIYSVIKSYAGYVTLLICGVIGVANYFVKQFRGTELQIMDIKSVFTAISVVGNYRFHFSLMLYTVMILLVISAGLLALRQTEDGEETETANKKRYKLRGGAAVCGIVIYVVINGIFVSRESFNWFNMNTNFVEYGWFYTNMIIQKGSKLRKPEKYSDEDIQNILAGITEEENVQEIIPHNVIVIMNESLGDLGTLGGLSTNQDYMPFIHNLEENAVKGDLYVSTFGGNTAITEYEFLTGNTEHFFPQGMIPYSSLCEDQEEGLSRILKKQGFHTVAMHPYGSRNWNRDKVYDAMGFDEFISIEEYAESELLRNYVSDQANYEKIIEYVEGYKEDDPLFIFNVTMQNHGGYDINNGKMDGVIKIDNFESSVAETYLSLVYESDRAFEKILDYFSGYDEPTMIVMFGDHMPSLPDYVYDTIYGQAYSELSAAEKNKKYTTPYVIWTNYESDFEEKKTISANYLGSYLLKCAGLQMTDYNRFLLNFMEEVRAIGQYGYIDREGRFVSYEESDGHVFQEYEFIQYMRVKDRKSKYYGCFSIQDN